MEGRSWFLVVVVALIASGIWPFLSALLKRNPEVKQLDAQTTSITIQGAETTVTVLMRTLERAERREAELEAKLDARERKIDELESRLEDLSAKLHAAQDQLNDALEQLADLKAGR